MCDYLTTSNRVIKKLSNLKPKQLQPISKLNFYELEFMKMYALVFDALDTQTKQRENVSLCLSRLLKSTKTFSQFFGILTSKLL